MAKYSTKKVFEEFAPVLAGFQISVSLVSFFGIGAFANWVMEHWFPFTRWVWTEIFSKLELPELSNPEKDALTAVAFFLPIAISSFIKSRQKNRVEKEDRNRLLRIRLYAVALGFIFIYLIGSRVLLDMADIFTSAAKSDLLKIVYLGNCLPIITVFSSPIYRAYMSLRRRDYIENSRAEIKFKLFINGIAVLIMIGTGMVGITLLAVEGIGFIRAFSPFFVIGCLVVTVLFHPTRLLNTAGVVIALVGASACWEIALWVIEWIEKAPVST